MPGTLFCHELYIARSTTGLAILPLTCVNAFCWEKVGALTRRSFRVFIVGLCRLFCVIGNLQCDINGTLGTQQVGPAAGRIRKHPKAVCHSTLTIAQALHSLLNTLGNFFGCVSGGIYCLHRHGFHWSKLLDQRLRARSTTPS